VNFGITAEDRLFKSALGAIEQARLVLDGLHEYGVKTETLSAPDVGEYLVADDRGIACIGAKLRHGTAVTFYKRLAAIPRRKIFKLGIEKLNSVLMVV
jgi:hypothetical protein